MSHPVYLFGEYRVDPLARELHRGSELLALSPKVFDCLVYLIEHRDRAVGRDELIAAVWGKLDVSDTLLGHNLAGGAVGLRGKYKAVQFDLALATPLVMPAGFATRCCNLYASATYAY